jgi:hypothetical protein
MELNARLPISAVLLQVGVLFREKEAIELPYGVTAIYGTNGTVGVFMPIKGTTPHSLRENKVATTFPHSYLSFLARRFYEPVSAN